MSATSGVLFNIRCRFDVDVLVPGTESIKYRLEKPEGKWMGNLLPHACVFQETFFGYLEVGK